MYTMQVFITLDQIKPPGIISLMVCLSIRQHIAALDRYHTDSIKISKLHVKDIVVSGKKKNNEIEVFKLFSHQDLAEQTVWKQLKRTKLELQLCKDTFRFPHLKKRHAA